MASRLSRVTSKIVGGVPGLELSLPALCLGFNEGVWELSWVTVEDSVVVLVTVAAV